MEKSFRQILSEHLEERSAPVTDSAVQPTAKEMFFTWHPSSAARWPKGHGYPKATVIMAAKAPPPPEILIPLNTLTEDIRRHAEQLIALGADDLSAGLSLKRLKAAYRRLVKRWHPDVSPGTSAQFMIVQRAYKALNQALNGSAGGSESASASKTQHPNAS